MKKIFYLASFMLLFAAAGWGIVSENTMNSIPTGSSTVCIDPDLCIGCGSCISEDPLEQLMYNLDGDGKVSFYGNKGAYILSIPGDEDIYIEVAKVCPTQAFVFE